MSIQQDINSAFGQMGILAALNPEFQELKEYRKIKEEDKTISKRNKVLDEKIEKEKENISNITESMKKMTPEELKSKKKELSASEENVKFYEHESNKLQEKRDELTRRGYNIAPRLFKNRYFDLEQREFAQQRAEQIANDKAVAKKKHQEYMSNLHKGINRTMQGFKDMSREQQENIIKKITPGDRRKIANEEKWRNQIYGK